jgi:glycosyltransferase involved in cell wall biosynthesis
MTSALWVTAIEPCFDAGGGGQIRQAHLLDALTRRFEVDLLLAGRLEDERLHASLRSVTEIDAPLEPDPRNPWQRRFRDIWWQLVLRQPDEAARHKRTRAALIDTIRRWPEHDVVCVEYIGLARIIPTRRRGLWALTLHNLTSGMARHSASIAPGRRQQLMLGLEEQNSRRLEHWAVGAYDLVVTPSSEDASELPAGVEVVPNGVDIARFRPSSVSGEHRLVFTGALHTLPNRDGIEWFCREVWPLIRARVPDAKLDVVGSAPPSEIRALASLDGVSVHADVPDVVPFLRCARVAVVPLRIGTGSRLKALEAMAAGRPVVGTAIGLGGLEVAPGRDALIADDPVGFADAVERCLSDAEFANELGRRGRALAEEKYSWGAIGDRYVALLDERITERPVA